MPGDGMFYVVVLKSPDVLAQFGGVSVLVW